MNCVVCDGNDPVTSENPIFECADCGICVHKLCYGITAKFGDVDPWWCSPCSLGQNSVSCKSTCKLCLQNGGALKKTTCDNWVHVVCALFTNGTIFTNKQCMEPVNISNIPQEHHGQTCFFCSEVRGICGKCSDRNCDFFLHITCGQKYKCLREKTNSKNKKIIFEAYCRQHNPKSSHRLSSAFILETLAAKDDLSGQKDYGIIETVEISSDTIGESLTVDSVIHSKTDNSNEIENSEIVADHFTNASYPRDEDIGASSTLLSDDKTKNANDSRKENVSDFWHGSGIIGSFFAHDTNNKSNTTNKGSAINDTSKCTDASNEFWWDYFEWRKRESELEGELRSKDEEIDKVKCLMFFII